MRIVFCFIAAGSCSVIANLLGNIVFVVGESMTFRYAEEYSVGYLRVGVVRKLT